MQPAAVSRTAFGISLEPDEQVVFAHIPPPISAGERLGLMFIGLLLLVIVVGLFIIIHAFTKQADRAWFLTTKRAINVTATGKVRQIKLDQIRTVVNNKNVSTIDLGWGNNIVHLPLAHVEGTHLLTILGEPTTNVPRLPPIAAPP
jgi:hypothetical protein